MRKDVRNGGLIIKNYTDEYITELLSKEYVKELMKECYRKYSFYSKEIDQGRNAPSMIERAEIYLESAKGWAKVLQVKINERLDQDRVLDIQVHGFKHLGKLESGTHSKVVFQKRISGQKYYFESIKQAHLMIVEENLYV